MQQKIKQTGRQWARPATYQIGELVSERYEIRDVVGTGPLGLVYKAFDQEVDVDVALKVIASEFLPDQAAREQFKSTMTRTLDLVHENVVRYFDVDHDGDHCFYVMQFLEGLTLRKIMNLRRDKKQCFSIDEVEPIFVQLCSALGKTSLQLIHGGVKPENIIILPDLLKVTDFALFDAIPRAYYLSAQQAAGGAARYLAPEIREGREVDVSADVYSIAVILVELLTGKVSAEEKNMVPPLEGEVPEAFERVLRKALSDNPLNRYNHPGELGEDLTAALTGKPVRSTLIYGGHKDFTIPNAPASELVQEKPGPGAKEDSLHMDENPTTLFKIEEEDEPEEKIDNFWDHTDPAAPPQKKEHSQITHQLALDEIEFASQKIEIAALLSEERTGDSSPMVGESTERTDLDAIVSRADEEQEEILDRSSDAGEVQRGNSAEVGGGGGDFTQQIDADMILPLVDDDHEEEIFEASGALTIPPAGLELLAPDPDPQLEELARQERIGEEVREASEARAREALLAFDFDASGKGGRLAGYNAPGAADYDKISTSNFSTSRLSDYEDDSVGDYNESNSDIGYGLSAGDRYDAESQLEGDAQEQMIESAVEVEAARELPNDLAEEYVEEALAPFDEPFLSSTQADPMKVAPEVLNLDAVPKPIDVTQAVRGSAPVEEKLKLLPAVVVAFIALVIGGTMTLIFYISKTQDTAVRHEIARKKALTHEQAPTVVKPAGRQEAQETKILKVETLSATKDSSTPEADEGAAPSTKDDRANGLAQVQSSPLTVPIPPPRTPIAPPGTPIAQPGTNAPRLLPKAQTSPHTKAGSNPRAKLATRPVLNPKAAHAIKATPGGQEKSQPQEKAVPPTIAAKCPQGMQLIKNRGIGYCIDRYEYPGQGKMPKHGISLAQARTTCGARGLRLCTAKEWLRSCGSLFPYGRIFKPNSCNTGTKGAVPAGSKKGCRSKWGVYDLSGNVSEWVEEGVAMGGAATAVEGHATCPARSDGGPLTGFRCCGDLGWD